MQHYRDVHQGRNLTFDNVEAFLGIVKAAPPVSVSLNVAENVSPSRLPAQATQLDYTEPMRVAISGAPNGSISTAQPALLYVVSNSLDLNGLFKDQREVR